MREVIGLVILFSIVISFSVIPVFAQSSIVVTTDKASYSEGETILITGEVSQLLGGYALSVRVLAPNGNIVSIEQVTVGSDKKFSSLLDTGEITTMNAEGTYTVVAQYGDNKNNVGGTTFEYEGSTSTTPINISFTNPRSVDAFGNVLTNIQVSQQIQISADIINHNNFVQPFAYYISIRGTEVEAWITGSLSSGQSFSPALSWIPIEAGTFTVDISLFDNLENKNKLSESLILQITVEGTVPNPTISVSSDKSTYHESEMMKVWYYISEKIPNEDFTITLYDPSGKNIGSTMFGHYYLNVGDNDSYTTFFPYDRELDDGIWYVGGIYTLVGEYAGAKYTLTVNVISSKTYPNPAPSGTDVVIPRGTGVPGCEETRSCYDPYGIVVGPYSTITWYNADSVAHTVTSGSPGSGGSGEFDSSLFMPGESFSHKFSRDGTFNYFCMVHPWMEGQVIVKRGIVTEPPTYDTTPPKILQPTDITIDAENNIGVRVSYDVLVIDETDQIVKPICNPSSGSYFAIGTTKVTCNASDSSGNRAQSVSFSITVNPPDVAIPDWIKNIAEFWCEDKIDNASFIEGIQYLIDNNIIIVSASSGYGSTQEIPNWVKNNACWWSQGLITSDDFASGIEYLVKEGIIRV